MRPLHILEDAMRRLAIFVDAGYFWAQVSQVVHRKKTARAETVIHYARLRQVILDTAQGQFPETLLLRVYWYDGPGNVVNGNFMKAVDHNAIDELDDFKLRLGTRNVIGQQKGVDGLIIADLIGLAQNHAINDALLMSGDADLAPGVVAAQNLGLRVHLLTMGKSSTVSPYLKAEVDRKTHLDDAEIGQFAAPANPREEPPLVLGDEPVAKEPVKESAENEPRVDEKTLRVVAFSCYNSLDPDMRLQIKVGKPIPPAIDRVLLRHGREQIRPKLTAREKIDLREQLKIIAELGQPI